MTETGSPPSTLDRVKRLLPVLIFFAALLIRLPGIGWGLKNDLHNQSYHPDEPTVLAYSQQIEPGKLDFTPGFYNYGTLYLTLTRIASDMTAAYTGGVGEKDVNTTWAFDSRAHLAGRTISALAGAGTALVVFLMLRRRVGAFGALAGAGLIAVAPAHVVHSRFQTVDILATFLLAVSSYFALKLLDRAEEEPDLKDAVWAGVFAGLSAGTKYTGLLAILTLLTVLALVRRRHLVREGIAGVAAAFATFVVVTPGVLLETEQFIRDFKYEMAHTATGHGLVFTGTGSGFIYHLGNIAAGVGMILGALALAGLAFLAIQKRVWILALLAFFLPYYVLIGRAEIKFIRYTFPLYVGLAAGFGGFMAEMHRKRRWGMGFVALGLLGLGGADSRGLIGTAQATTWMSGEDPRDAAARWLRANPVANVGLVQDPWFWSVPTFPNATIDRRYVVGPRRPAFIEEMRATSRPPTDVVSDENGNVLPFDSRVVSELRPETIVMTAFEFSPRERLVGRTDIAPEFQSEATRYRDFMQALSKDYRLERRFGNQSNVVEDLQYINPVVLVWKRTTPR